MKLRYLIVTTVLLVVACTEGKEEVYCEGPSIVATKGAYLFQQDCRLLCADCYGEPADASVCVGGDAGVPHCPCNDNGPVTFCWAHDEVAIHCDASICN